MIITNNNNYIKIKKTIRYCLKIYRISKYRSSKLSVIFIVIAAKKYRYLKYRDISPIPNFTVKTDVKISKGYQKVAMFH